MSLDRQRVYPQVKRLYKSSKHLVELWRRQGRLGAPYQAPFEVTDTLPMFALRRYMAQAPSADEAALGAPLLLIPPLMVTTQVYDISPELSAVSYLRAQGVDVWAVDFGAPEHVEGGLERTLDDHILAVAQAIELVAEHTGRAVHLAGYSQGGLFAYQGAAYLRARSVASIITFGSPVDVRRALPVPMHDELAKRVISALVDAVSLPLEQLDGLPGSLTSRGFKILNAGKEVKQILSFFAVLDDREALLKREPKRRFLAGDGFVAWPGPAFRQFVDDIVVHNRLAEGGLVVAGRAISMADLSCPILYFVGLNDDLARPASVRSVRRYALNAALTERVVDAGHFGLVVGSRAMNEVWPAVVRWIEHHEGVRPEPLAPRERLEADGDAGARKQKRGQVIARRIVGAVWAELGRASLKGAQRFDDWRWQLPRYLGLGRLRYDAPMSVSDELEAQAKRFGDQPLLLWQGRAFSYEAANLRVNRVCRALSALGVVKGQLVALFIEDGAALLTLAMALNRLGAVAMPCAPTALENPASAAQLFAQAGPSLAIVDEARLTFVSERAQAQEVSRWAVYAPGASQLALPDGVASLGALASAQSDAAIEVEHGRFGGDLALLLWSKHAQGQWRAVRISNRRWLMASLGMAAAGRLKPSDTVYCPLPLHEPQGLLLAAGGALVSGSRLALASASEPESFWAMVRRCGATVVFYGHKLGASILATEHLQRHTVRLFVGQGLDDQAWLALKATNPHAQLLEFLALAEGNLCLINGDERKKGAYGAPLPGLEEHVALVQWPVAAAALGPMRCQVGQAGMIIAKDDPSHAVTCFEGYWRRELEPSVLLRDVFAPGDRWFVTGVMARQDSEGDYWPVV